MSIAVKLTGLQLRRAQIAPSKAGLTFLEFRPDGRDSEASPGYWRRKASATVARREIVHYPDDSVAVSGGWLPYCNIMLRSLGDSDLGSEHPVLAQGELTVRELVCTYGPLEVELYSDSGYGDVVGTLHMQLSHQGDASDFVPLSEEASDWWGNSWEEEDEEGSSGDDEESLALDEWTLLDLVPLRHDHTWPDMRPKAAWGGRPPPTAQEVARLQQRRQESRPFLHRSLALLARCKMALAASNQELPGGAFPTLPQTGWQGVAGSHHTSWKEYLGEVQGKLRRLGVTEAVTRLTHLPPSWGDDVSSLGYGCDPLTIAQKLSLAGLAEGYDPLYRYVYGRSIAEALEDLPNPWKEEEQHVKRVLRELDVEDAARLSGVGEGLL